jgi:hypothetical protein
VCGLPLVSVTVWLVSSVTSPAGVLLLLLPALLLSPPMSSSPPTESSWDLLFSSTTASSSAMSSVVSLPAPSQVSGEFNAFVQLGSAVGGAGVKPLVSCLVGSSVTDVWGSLRPPSSALRSVRQVVVLVASCRTAPRRSLFRKTLSM